MTLEDIEKIPKEFLTAADVAPYLRSDPNSIRVQAHNRPELLGFPLTIVRRRVKIPKALFVQHFRGRETQKEAANALQRTDGNEVEQIEHPVSTPSVNQNQEESQE